MEVYTPVNFRRRNTEEIERAVNYALQVGKNYISQISALPDGLEGRSVLEVGPGSDFGPALLLASSGAKVSIIDRFFAKWQEDYHRPLYTALRNRWSGDPAPFDAVLNANGYGDIITVFSCALEDLAEDRKFDVIISNAVLEHMRDIEQAVESMARITQYCGWGLHQIDFRDHRNFSKPLEYLLYTDEEFEKELGPVLGECGQPYRTSELEALFLKHGFEIDCRNINMIADESYLADFLPRLRASASRYRNWQIEDLRNISAFYRIKRQDTR